MVRLGRDKAKRCGAWASRRAAQRSAAQKGRLLVFAVAAAAEQRDCRVSAHAVKARSACNAYEGYWRRRLCPWPWPRCVAVGGESRAAVSGISGRAGDDDDAGGH